MRFTERCEFTGDPAEVWARASDLETIAAYWHGTREFTVREDGGKTRADVVFAFGGKGAAEVAVDGKSRTLTIEYVDGPFKGRQTVVVTDEAIEAEWDVAFKGVYRVLGPWNASHFRSGTRHALQRICAGQTG
ncbi:MAG: SRPBCC family protein [Nitrososphaerales archaeon]|jgi:hypothetical protein